jgi:hypothetical protein
MDDFKIEYTMTKISFFLFFACICLAFQSCNRNQKKVEILFNKVENIVEQQPDSALILLDSIQNPYELSKDQYAKYILLSVQAKDKAYQDIASDTLIFQSGDYFQKKNDQKNLALSEFYCARVLQSQEKFEEAMKTYLKAKERANKGKNVYLCGMSEFFIGELNYNKYLFDEAIIHYKNAFANFSLLEKKYKNQIAACSCIGNSYLLIDLPDSAFFYYNKGLELAKQCNDSIVQIDIIQNMGVAYLKVGNANQAKVLLKKALYLTKDSINKAKIYMNLAEVSLQENKKDSASYYTDLALGLSEDNNSLKSNIYKLLSEIEESSGNYQKSLDYHKQYSKYLASDFEEIENSNISDVQKKYDFELLQNANEKLVIQRLWIFIISILIITVISFFYYRNRTQNKEAMLTAKQQIYLLKEMVEKREKDNHDSITMPKNNDDSDNKKLRDTLFKQLDIFKKISLLEAYLRDEEKEKGKEILKKVNDIIYDSNDQFDWELFYQPVNTLYDNFLLRLKNLYPALDEDEILICCLSKIGLNNTEIALLTKKSNQNIIQKKKTVIRQKIGMTKQDNFTKQLNEIIKNNTDSANTEA